MTSPAEPDDELPPLPGTRSYVVYADESGISGKKYYGFGSLWMPWDRRGDFHNIIRSLRLAHGYDSEMKWTKVKGGALDFYKDVVAEFFRVKWLMFHCLVVRKGLVDKAFHRDDEEAMRKHFAVLMTSKIGSFAKGCPDKRYRLRVDPMPYSYGKADEAAFKIINSTLKQRLVHPAVDDLIEKDSKLTPGIQLADVLLGAVMDAWQREASAEAKLELSDFVAEHLGWPDLRADTKPHEWKFNIWYFTDMRVSREATTRPVNLKYKLPPLRSRTASRR